MSYTWPYSIAPFLQTDDAAKSTALKHLQAAWHFKGVVFPEEAKQQGAQKFFQGNKDTLIEVLKYLRTRQSCLSLLNLPADLTPLTNDAYQIVVTDDQLNDPGAQQSLTVLLEGNPNHTVILSVGGSSVDQNGTLKLHGDRLPPLIRHLRLVNPKGNVTSIGDSFLTSSSFSSIDMSALCSVTSIGRCFLFHNKSLTYFDTSGLINVTSIGDDFFSCCGGLTSIYTLGLSNVRSIGKNFFSSMLPPNLF